MTTQDVEHSKLEKLLLEITISRLKGESFNYIRLLKLLERLKLQHPRLHLKYRMWRKLRRFVHKGERYAKIIELIKEQIEIEKLTAKHD